MNNSTTVGNISLDNLEDRLFSYPHYRVHHWLNLYVPPVLLVMGTVGNLLSFIILTRKAMSNVSSYVYLAVLSITDTLALYIGLFRLWIAKLTDYEIKNQADWICKTISVLGYTVSDYSVWLIVAVTVERYIAVCHALKAPGMCNRTRAVKVIVGIGAIIFAINFHFFFTTRIMMNSIEEGSEQVRKCGPAEGMQVLFTVWHFVDAFIYSFLPFVILSVLNGLIIHTVLMAKHHRHVLSERVTTNDHQGKRGGNSPSHHKGHGESSARLTVMLLTISFTFVITTLPVNINLILRFYWTAILEGQSYEEQFRLVAKASMVGTITELLMYTNHSVNFFLYCATGQKFRQQLCELLSCGKRRRANRTFFSEYSQKFLQSTTRGRQPDYTLALRENSGGHQNGSRTPEMSVHYTPALKAGNKSIT